VIGHSSPATRARTLHGPKRRSRTIAVLTIAALLATTATACTGPPWVDAEDEGAVQRLVNILDRDLAGRDVQQRSDLTRLLVRAHDAVVAGTPGSTRPGTMDFAPYLGAGQEIPEDAPVALAIWDQRTGADPFTDDVPRWHRSCIQVSIDRAAAGLAVAFVSCPAGIPDEPPGLGGTASPRTLQVTAPTTGQLLTGDPARTGAPTAALVPTDRPVTAYPCASEGLAATFEAFSLTSGQSDQVTLRVVNTGSDPCTAPEPADLRLSQDPDDVPVRLEVEPRSPIALTPGESATARVTWAPSQQVNTDTPQRVELELGTQKIEVRPGVGTPDVALPINPGVTLQITPWQILGYGATLDDANPRTDIAPPCDQTDLAVLTREVPIPSGSTSPPPSVDVINLGATTCRITPGTYASRIDGLPPFVEAPLVRLDPGDLTTLETTKSVPPRPDQAYVNGHWIHVTPSQQG